MIGHRFHSDISPTTPLLFTGVKTMRNLA